MISKDIHSVLMKLKRIFASEGALSLETPYKTIVGVVLSARTRDEQVLKLLPDLFLKFPTVYNLASANEEDIRQNIKTIGMNRIKAKHLRLMAIKICNDFNGRVPDDMENLLTLPGVGRKTASIVLSHCFNKPAIAVDTHVHRIANRLGWVETNTPAKTEKALLRMVSKKDQSSINSVFVKHGRYICLPGKPRCYICPIKDECNFKNKNLVIPKNSETIADRIKKQEEFTNILKSKI
ncbi:endonuclease III [Patescibacteria group bacterium]|nr:endonuclease III [Patescibacteria group bacterium]